MKEDARRGKIFTKLSRQIIVAARDGGGDPEHNFRLRLAIEKARSYNMPADTIERAIKRGTGELGGETYEQLIYEGYGPGGVAIMLDIMTDNRNRTASEIRHLFAKHGGNLGESGCVAWMFEKRGVLVVDPAAGWDEEQLLLVAVDAGADDVEVGEDELRVLTQPEAFQQVKEALEKAGVKLAQAQVTWLPKTTVAVAGVEAKRLLDLLDALEDHDDVQEVYANLDVDQEALQAVEA